MLELSREKKTRFAFGPQRYKLRKEQRQYTNRETERLVKRAQNKKDMSERGLCACLKLLYIKLTNNCCNFEFFVLHINSWLLKLGV